jgi:hypothetical protein
MKLVVQILFLIGGFIAVAGFVGAFAAHVKLQFCIDHRRVKEETGEPGWKIFGSILAGPEFYKEQARWVWRVRDLGFKTFAICIGCTSLLALFAAIMDIPFQ